MGNRMYIDTFQRVNTRTNVSDYMVEISDDHDYTTLIFAGDKSLSSNKNEVLPSDNIELLKFLIKEKHNEEHGSRCEALENILERARLNFQGVWIGGYNFDGQFFKEVLDHDIREVYFCPDCGWESFSDGDYEADCGQSDCDGNITEIKKEWYVI